MSERIRATLDKTFDSFVRRWDLADPRGVVVICYPPGEFSSRTGFHEDVGGAFDGRIRVAFPSELEDGGLTVDRVVRHEAIHLLLHSAGASPPRWLDEGVAQYLDGEERSRWWPQFRKALKAAPNVGLLDRERRFDHADRASWSVLYLHSFFFVKHLVKIGSEFRLDMVVREVRQGRRWGVAVESVYGSSASELDRKWRRTVLEAPESQ